MLTLFFFAKHAAVLFVILAAAAGAGTLVAGTRQPLALRSALGLAVWAEALFLLAAVGWLRPMPLIVMAIVAIAGGATRGRGMTGVDKRWIVAAVVIATPAFLLALYPPLAFDETLYHLPFVRALAQSGELRFLAGLRFPVFPQFHELLCVPVYLLAGDAATHLVSLAEVIVTTALLATWARRYTPPAAPLAAALFVASPIVIQLGTILHVDAALTLFVAAGFYALDVALDVALAGSRRAPLLLAALFFGAACSVKYLGGFFAFAALVIVVIARRREAWLFAAATAAAALPTTLWLVLNTGNPVFPFLPSLFGANDWELAEVARPHRLLDTLRALWDATFARERIGMQPPVTPLLIPMVLLVAAAGVRHRQARAVALIAAGTLALFAFLPQDTRYLVPLLPLLCVAAAVITATQWPRAMPILMLFAVAFAIAYPVWRLATTGWPPADAHSRHAMIVRRIAGYEALTRAGTARVYTCGGEQLQSFAAGPLLGDFNGPHSYARIIDSAADTSTLAARLRRLDVDFFLVIKKRCAPRRNNGGLALDYEDADAQLWRVVK